MTTKLWTPERHRQRVERSKNGDVRVNLPSRISLPGKLDIRDPSALPPLGGAAADAWQFTNTSRGYLLDGTFDIDTDSFKMALFLSTSDIADTEDTYAGVTNEHTATSNYTTGGIAVALTVAGTTTITVDITTDPVWTASGGSIVCRYAVIYEVAGNVLCWTVLDNAPLDVTATDGNTLTVAANASGVFTLAGA